MFETIPTNLNESFDAMRQVTALGFVLLARKLRRENAGSGWISIAGTEPVVVAVVRVVVVTIGDPAVVCIVVPVATAQQSLLRALASGENHFPLPPCIRKLYVFKYAVNQFPGMTGGQVSNMPVDAAKELGKVGDLLPGFQLAPESHQVAGPQFDPVLVQPKTENPITEARFPGNPIRYYEYTILRMQEIERTYVEVFGDMAVT